MRQITFYEYEVGVKRFESVEGTDMYQLACTPVTTVEATSLTKSDVRKAIIEAGVECPRGTEVYWTKKSKVLYRFTTEALLAAAESREVLPLD